MHKYSDKRGIPMSYLSPIEREGQKYCAWCEVGVLKGRRKYCKKACMNSALIHFYPQTNESKMYHLIYRQNCACAGCGTSMEDELSEIIERKYHHHNDHLIKENKKPLPVGLWAVGYGTGDRWQVDHSEPLFKGGQGPGVENIQILCVDCHRKKSAREKSSTKGV